MFCIYEVQESWQRSSTRSSFVLGKLKRLQVGGKESKMYTKCIPMPRCCFYLELSEQVACFSPKDNSRDFTDLCLSFPRRSETISLLGNHISWWTWHSLSTSSSRQMSNMAMDHAVAHPKVPDQASKKLIHRWPWLGKASEGRAVYIRRRKELLDLRMQIEISQAHSTLSSHPSRAKRYPNFPSS